MTEHARLSPSGAHRWMSCPGSLLAEEGLPDRSSSYAQWGTAAHEFAALFLKDNYTVEQASDLVGVLGVDVEDTLYPLDDEMLDCCWTYVKLVRDLAEGKSLLVEQRLSFSHYIGVPDQFGTSDAVILGDDTITVVDLKTGMGVKVDAEGNEQLMLYALGALANFDVLGDFTHVQMVISQPRLNHVSDHTITVEELLAFAERAKVSAQLALTPDAPRNPSEDACRFCKAKATCPALKSEVLDIVAADASDFDDLTSDNMLVGGNANWLGLAMSKVGMVEDWCKAIRAEVERQLFAGEEVPGFKLVEGRAGNRSWVDDSAAEDLFKSFRLKKEEMYDFKLISPTKAEKLVTPARWAKLNKLVERAPGKPSVAPVTDKRPAYSVAATAEDFG